MGWWTATSEFRVVPVSRLTDSDYTHEKVPNGCMNRGRTQALVWRLRRRLGHSCCWYHNGDWRRVVDLAIALLRKAHTAGKSEQWEITWFVLKQPAATSLTGWQHEALRSLFIEPITPPDDDSEWYVNGRHRSRALRDAGVKWVVVAEQMWTNDEDAV